MLFLPDPLPPPLPDPLTMLFSLSRWASLTRKNSCQCFYSEHISSARDWSIFESWLNPYWIIIESLFDHYWIILEACLNHYWILQGGVEVTWGDQDPSTSRLSRSRDSHTHSPLTPRGFRAPRLQPPGWISGVCLRRQTVLLSLLSKRIA